MKRAWKRHLVTATVLLFVCAAVYLNWKYAGNVADVLPAGGEKVLGQSELVSAEAEESGAVQGDYFAAARLTRQQARDNAISLLREAAESENADTEAANAAAETIQVLAGYALAEAQIENLVTAKGYARCVAFMGEDSISVVVSAPDGDALGVEDVARITDIVLTETDYKAEQIKIMEAD